ncbi:MAG TPA: DEAD/DEAH box helicase, partial [Pseudonocardiaceae bacterium]
MSTPDAPTSFAALDLPRPLVSALARDGIEIPFPIQAACVPDALAGRDILGRGRTGSGKTLAFGLPLLTRAAGEPAAPRRPVALVLVPTRELAQQVRDVLEPLGRGLCVRVRAVLGGTSFPKQVEMLRRGVEVLVATPGRLTDLIEQGQCSLADVRAVVLDEADQMADMGFLPAVRVLLDQVPAGGQRMLFSATLDREVDTLVRDYLVDPLTHSMEPASASVPTMAHHALLVARRDKVAVTAAIANRPGRTILFARTRHGVDRLADSLREVGVRAGTLHGGKAQAARTKVLAQFREGRFDALIATDVAARGIHVDDVTLVLHVDPPADPKDYLHRAGRTARGGDTGTVATLVCPNEVRSYDSITRQAGVQPTRTRVAPDDPALAEITGARPVTMPAGGFTTTTGETPAQRPERYQRTESERPYRGGGSPRYAGPGRRTDDRPRRDDRAGRPAHGDRSERPRYEDRSERASFGDRAERPRRDDRAERRPYGDRPERPRY